MSLCFKNRKSNFKPERPGNGFKCLLLSQSLSVVTSTHSGQPQPSVTPGSREPDITSGFLACALVGTHAPPLPPVCLAPVSEVTVHRSGRVVGPVRGVVLGAAALLAHSITPSASRGHSPRPTPVCSAHLSRRLASRYAYTERSRNMLP